MDNPLAPSPYETLNVSEDATLATIQRGYRKLVLSCHPDREPDESAKKEKAEQFHQVQQAYEILSDENRRQRYDEKVKLAELRAEAVEKRRPSLSQKSYDQASRPSYRSVRHYESLSASSGYSASNFSNDSGYVTKTPSANSATTKQSDPLQSFIHSHQLSEQTVKLAKGKQRSPDAEPVCVPPISSSGLKLSEYFTQGYKTLRPPPLNTGHSGNAYSMNRTSSHGSSDSGYATRTPSVANPTQHQSYPVQSYPIASYSFQSYPAQIYTHSRQPSQQSSTYSYNNQLSPDIEVVRAASISSSKYKKERRLSTPSPSSPSEYPCLYPKCGHISSRAHDLKRHMTVHFPPAVEELLDCKYECCGRTGTHGFKREEHRKEHYRTHTLVVLENENMPIHIKTIDRKSAASQEGLPLSGKLQTSEPSTRDVAQLWNPQSPKIYEKSPNEKTAGLKIVPDSNSVIPEGILDDIGARNECEHRHPRETVHDRIENLRSSVFRDTTEEKVTMIRSQVLLTLLANEAGQYCASLNMQWDILSFMEDQYRENDFPNKALAPVITISGSAKHAQATTCSEYTRQNWPAYGSKVLKALQEALDNPSHRSKLKIVARCDGGNVFIDDAPSSHAELEFYVTHEDFILDIRFGTPDMIGDIVQQLVWMGAALRTSRDGRVQYCKPKLEGGQFEREEPAIFNITFDVSSPGEEDQSCWFPLFLNPVIAHGFPTPHRNHNEVGLEIPLEMMAALGGARHVVDFEGGLVLKGYSALFVPIKCHEGSVQWHLIRARGEDRMLYRQLRNECLNRALLEEVDHESLRTTRAFLGWWKCAQTHLGTADAAYDKIDWSPAGEAKRPARFSGANIGFQTMITGQLNFIMGAKDGRLHFLQKGPFQRIVQCAEKTPVVLYDPADRRAWFVPGLDLMLHIVQTRHHLSPYKIDGENVKLTPVNPESGRLAATEAVAANRLRRLYERDVAAEKDYYFKDVILDIWSQMERLMEKDDSMEAYSGLALHGTMQSKVHGWEYMSLVHGKNYRRKEATVAKSSGGWVDLINDIDALVLFATGLDEIIRPVSDLNNLCHLWRSLPKGKDYLATSVPILELLYSEAGSRLSHKHLSTSHLQWHRGSTLFEQCSDKVSHHCECDRTQQIYHDSLVKTFGRVRPPGNLQEDGCVIFGQAHHPFKPPKTHNAVYMLPNTSIQNAESTKQILTNKNSLLSPSPPPSVSPESEARCYAIRSPKRPPSPLSFGDDLAEEETVVPKRRRKVSDVQTSKSDTCKGPNNSDDELSSDDFATCPTEPQSTLKHNAASNGRNSGRKQTVCASEAEYKSVHALRTIRRKANIEDFSHRHGCSCMTCSTVDFEQGWQWCTN